MVINNVGSEVLGLQDLVDVMLPSSQDSPGTVPQH